MLFLYSWCLVPVLSCPPCVGLSHPHPPHDADVSCPSCPSGVGSSCVCLWAWFWICICPVKLYVICMFLLSTFCGCLISILSTLWTIFACFPYTWCWRFMFVLYSWCWLFILHKSNPCWCFPLFMSTWFWFSSYFWAPCVGVLYQSNPLGVGSPNGSCPQRAGVSIACVNILFMFHRLHAHLVSAFHMFIFRSLVLTCHICPFRLVYVVQPFPDNLVLTFPISSVHLVFGFHAVPCEIQLAVSYLSCQPGDDVSSDFCPPSVRFSDLSCASNAFVRIFLLTWCLIFTMPLCPLDCFWNVVLSIKWWCVVPFLAVVFYVADLSSSGLFCSSMFCLFSAVLSCAVLCCSLCCM